MSKKICQNIGWLGRISDTVGYLESILGDLTSETLSGFKLITITRDFRPSWGRKSQ